MPNTPTEASPALDHGSPTNAARADQLKADISARLRRVCSHLTDEQFAALVDDVAQVTLRYQMPGRRGD
jgi:hypothetical protein